MKTKDELKDNFIKRSNKTHNNKYDYSFVEYINNKTQVKIICPEHGIFEQRPDNHSNRTGCPNCRKITNDIFINKCREVHKNRYNYDFTEYKNNRLKVKIVCINHGLFEQKASSHLEGVGCPICRNEEIRKRFVKNKNYFLQKSKEIHGDKYDYSLVEYINNKIHVTIICPTHGKFEQTPSNHYNYGCKLCKESQGERNIMLYLEEKSIKYIRQKTFQKCKNKQVLPFDFYLPEHNICIEYDGIQHFRPVKYFGGDEKLKTTQKHDKIKNIYCEENNIKLIRIKYNENIVKKLNKNL